MAETDAKSAVDPKGPVEVIVASATEALGSAFVVWILGGVALSIAGAFARDMIPSLPPGLAGEQVPKGHHAVHYNAWWREGRSDAFVLFFAIFFVHSLWAAFHGGKIGGGKRIQRILAKLRENWFGLVVGNAISAWVATLVLGITQNFLPLQMLWHMALALMLPILREISRFVFGEAATAGLGAWFSWYDSNQIKLTFWVIYLGGVFDDLGVPNFKSLAKWGWRRFQKRKETSATPPVDGGEAV